MDWVVYGLCLVFMGLGAYDMIQTVWLIVERIRSVRKP